jgi:TP901 family phage tail tape measure protein
VPTAAAKQNRTLEILLTAKDQTRSTLRRVKQEMLGTVRTIRGGFASATRAAGAFRRQIFNLRNAILLGAGAAMTKFAADFEDQLMQVRGLIDDPSFSLQPFSRGVRDIAIETGDSFDSLTKSLFDTISAGVDAGSALEVLRSAAKLAAAGGTDTATAVDGLTSLLNAYGLEASEATRITDALFQAQKKGKTTIAELSSNVGQVAPLAATLGVSIEEVTGALAALTTAGLSTEEAATQVKSFFTAIIKPGAEAKRAAAELGMEFDASAVSGGRFLEFIKQLEDATGGSTEQLARLFPNVRSLQGVLGLARNEGKDFAETLDAMAKGAGSVEKAFAQTNATLGAQIRSTWRSVQSSMIDVIEGLRPVIEDLLSTVRGFFVRLSRSRDEFVAVFRGVGKVLLRIKDVIKTAFAQGDTFQLLVNSAVAAVEAISGVFFDAIPLLAKTTALLGRQLGVSLIRTFIGTTKEELVRFGTSGSLGNQLIASQIFGGQDELVAARDQLAQIDRLRQAQRSRGSVLQTRGLVDANGNADREKILAQLEDFRRRYKAVLAKIQGYEAEYGEWNANPANNAGYQAAQRQADGLRKVIAEFELLAVDADQAREKIRQLEAEFNGSQQVGASALRADLDATGAELEAFWAKLPARFSAIKDRLSQGVSGATAGALGDVSEEIAGLQGDFAKLRAAMAAAGDEAGKEFGSAMAKSTGPSITKKLGQQDEIAQAIQGLEDLGRAHDQLQERMERRGGLGGFLAGARESIKQYIASVRDTYTQATGMISSAVSSMENALGSAFVNISRRAKDLGGAFEDMARSILESIRQIMAQALARQIVGALLGAFTASAPVSSATDGTAGIPGVTAPDQGGGLQFLQSVNDPGSGSGDTYVTNYNISISAVDARSVERLFRENKELLAALNAETMDDSFTYRRKIRGVARGR